LFQEKLAIPINFGDSLIIDFLKRNTIQATFEIPDPLNDAQYVPQSLVPLLKMTEKVPNLGIMNGLSVSGVNLMSPRSQSAPASRRERLDHIDFHVESLEVEFSHFLNEATNK
jgi:hypothetical protein